MWAKPAMVLAGLAPAALLAAAETETAQAAMWNGLVWVVGLPFLAGLAEAYMALAEPKAVLVAQAALLAAAAMEAVRAARLVAVVFGVAA